MDIEKLEQLNDLKEKGILTQEEFEIEKQKLLNTENTETNDDQPTTDTLEDKASDFWHDYGMKVLMVVAIVIGVVYMQANKENMTIIDYLVLFGIASFVGMVIKDFQKQSKDIKDLHRYANIKAVINKFGTPDDIHNYGDYTKYVFKKSTEGWGHCKYQVDIFTVKKNKLIKHENYYE